MNVRHRVELSQTERADLTALLSGGKHAARKLKQAQILLAAWRNRSLRHHLFFVFPVSLPPTR